MFVKQDENEHEQKRLRILTKDEIKSIYDRPNFTIEEQSNFFTLSQPEKDLLTLFRNINSQAYFILQLGYFKAKRLFFTFNFCDVKEDILYILEQHFPECKVEDLTLVNKRTRLKQQKLILELFNYRACGSIEKNQIETKAHKAVAVCCKPVYIFREVMHYLYSQQIMIPGYSFMQEDIVGKTIVYEQNRLAAIVKNNLEATHINDLKLLLDDSDGLYIITQIKHEPKDFSRGEIKLEIQRGQQIHSLYLLAKNLLPKLEISRESIKYYSSMVCYYSVYKLKRLNIEIVYVYLLCFIYNRYQKVNDNLINTFIYNIRNYNDKSKTYSKEKIYESHIEKGQNFEKAGHVLKIFTDENIEPNTPFHEIRSKAFSILEPDKIVSVADQIVKDAKLDSTIFQWEYIDSLAARFKIHLRPIILMIDFESSLRCDPLAEAIIFLRTVFLKGKTLSSYPDKDFPIEFIPDSIKKYIFVDKSIVADRYEFLVYKLLRNNLESGDIFCHDSIKFHSFEDDLISDSKWQQKDKLIVEADLTCLIKPIREHLSVLKEELEEQIIEVNKRILSKENKYFKIKKSKNNIRWSLKYTSDSECTNSPFFDTLKPVDLSTILYFTDKECNFFEAFEHALGRYSKMERDIKILAACIIAWGTNMGLGRMAECSDISYSLLSAFSDNFIRIETLKEANDIVCNTISKLSFFKHFNIDGTIHSSSDGQKFETHIHTINSRHSPKYFGLGKGIAPYTIVINHTAPNAKNLGANEPENNFVFDMLYNNTTDIHPEIHSTDTHGTNEVNFAILNFFGYSFAPRYKDIYTKVATSLYGFKHPTSYDENLIIKPIRKINTDLIIAEWENIQRIILSLAQKTTTQSIIIGKLSSHERKNKTKSALWEYDNILKSLYLLNYIDSMQLRKNVQKALNRGESYHKLHRAISHANFGKLRFKTENEQNIWEECGRLIANCIIYYNTCILSKFMEAIGDSECLNLIKDVSPVAWSHIILQGRFKFKDSKEHIDITAIIKELELKFPKN
jgi:TnpA family transposase